jgi:uncharacterized protein
MRLVALALASLAALIAPPVLAEPAFPERGTAPVVDEANIIDPATEAALTQKLDQFEQRTKRQFVVATVSSLEGQDIADYGYQLGRHWGLGSKEDDNGVILLVAPNERKVRIEVGYGLEPVLTDGYSALIVQNTILPRFKAGDMPGGIVAGADAIIKQIELPPEEAAKVAQAADARAREGDGEFPIGLLIWGGFVLFFFILPMFRGKKGRRYNRGGLGGVGNIILWEALNAAARSGSRGSGGGFGGGGFGGGGGGFSGGGGSFGGGGASGGW